MGPARARSPPACLCAPAAAARVGHRCRASPDHPRPQCVLVSPACSSDYLVRPAAAAAAPTSAPASWQQPRGAAPLVARCNPGRALAAVLCGILPARLCPSRPPRLNAGGAHWCAPAWSHGSCRMPSPACAGSSCAERARARACVWDRCASPPARQVTTARRRKAWPLRTRARLARRWLGRAAAGRHCPRPLAARGRPSPLALPD